MTTFEENENETIEVKLFEHRGKNFKICREGVYGLWVVRHPHNMSKVAALDGTFTTLAQAERAIMGLSEGHFEKKQLKEVLVPKGPKVSKED
jgi:hypothetical protein